MARVQPHRRALLVATSAAAFVALPGVAQAAITVDDVSVTETNGNKDLAFTLKRDVGILALGTSVDFETADGTATAPGDYVAKKGTIVFPALPLGGTDERVVHVRIVGDTTHEPTETFKLKLSGNEVTKTEVTATINDDDPAPSGAPVSPPGGTPATPPSGPLTFSIGTPRLKKPSQALVSLTCPQGYSKCATKVTFKTRAEKKSRFTALRKTRTLGTKTIAIYNEKPVTLHLRLKSADLKLLKRAGRLKIRVRVVLATADGRVTARNVNGSLVQRTSHSTSN